MAFIWDHNLWLQRDFGASFNGDKLRSIDTLFLLFSHAGWQGLCQMNRTQCEFMASVFDLGLVREAEVMAVYSLLLH